MLIPAAYACTSLHHMDTHPCTACMLISAHHMHGHPCTTCSLAVSNHKQPVRALHHPLERYPALTHPPYPALTHPPYPALTHPPPARHPSHHTTPRPPPCHLERFQQFECDIEHVPCAHLHPYCNPGQPLSTTRLLAPQPAPNPQRGTMRTAHSLHHIPYCITYAMPCLPSCTPILVPPTPCPHPPHSICSISSPHLSSMHPVDPSYFAPCARMPPCPVVPLIVLLPYPSYPSFFSQPVPCCTHIPNCCFMLYTSDHVNYCLTKPLASHYNAGGFIKSSI